MTSYSVIAMVEKVVTLVPCIPRFEPRPIHMMFMGDKLALQLVFSQYFNLFPRHYSINNPSSLIYQ